ncbi:zinc transporter ZIP10 isoform X3 [Diaphorina citri]|uniref:Zinc transporter ZIP10 isoform X3 n=1 Tax=Diaphorina citri TaxID=121845 RepID=A0A3Q0J130_DIACI|nr:zinc transporter ZIP10 isoform X3 [Diaphorina citri]
MSALFLRLNSCLFLVACLCGTVLGNERPDPKSYEDVDHRYFLLELFQKYGQDGLIGYEGFEHLLSNLGLGGVGEVNEDHDVDIHKPDEGDFNNKLHDTLGLHNTKHEHMIHERSIDQSDTSNVFADEIIITEHNYGQLPKKEEVRKKLGHRCLSPKQMLVAYGLATDHSTAISPLMFLHICPAMIYQLDSKECTRRPPTVVVSQDDSSFKWLSALISVFLISVAGLVGVAVVPLIHKSMFAHLINFLVALAIGTLTGDAFLHLIPHALKKKEDESETTVVMKSTAVFIATFAFFILEKVIQSTQSIKKRTETLKMERASSEEDYSVVKNSDSCDGLADLDSTKREAVAWMIIMSDGIHNFTDGLSIGAAFGADFVAGIATSVAVFTHELPHELGDFAVLLKSGVSVRRALMYNVLSSVLSILGVLVGVILGDLQQASSWIYACTAGTFIYIALADLIPEMNRQPCSLRSMLLQLTGIFSGGAIMLIISLYEHKLKAFFFQKF